MKMNYTVTTHIQSQYTHTKSVITDFDNGKLCGIVCYWTLTIKQHVFWADNTGKYKKYSLEVKNKVQENKNIKRNRVQQCADKRVKEDKAQSKIEGWER